MKETIPAHVRAAIYSTYVVLVVVASATQVGYAAAPVTQPTWLTVALAVLLFLGTPVGVLAAVNVTPAAALVEDAPDP